MNRRATSSLVGILLLLSMFSIPVFAHHGTAAYDETKEITLSGTVVGFQWTNPHTQIYFDVTNEKGSVVHWACETVSPGMLLRAGWTKDTLMTGDKITVYLNRAKNGAPVGLLRKLVLADGRQLELQHLVQ